MELGKTISKAKQQLRNSYHCLAIF